MAGNRERVENQPSKLLNVDENKKLFDLLGHRCVVRRSSVCRNPDPEVALKQNDTE